MRRSGLRILIGLAAIGFLGGSAPRAEAQYPYYPVVYPPPIAYYPPIYANPYWSSSYYQYGYNWNYYAYPNIPSGYTFSAGAFRPYYLPQTYGTYYYSAPAYSFGYWRRW